MASGRTPTWTLTGPMYCTTTRPAWRPTNRWARLIIAATNLFIIHRKLPYYIINLAKIYQLKICSSTGYVEWTVWRSEFPLKSVALPDISCLWHVSPNFPKELQICRYKKSYDCCRENIHAVICVFYFSLFKNIYRRLMGWLCPVHNLKFCVVPLKLGMNNKKGFFFVIDTEW